MKLSEIAARVLLILVLSATSACAQSTSGITHSLARRKLSCRRARLSQPFRHCSRQAQHTCQRGNALGNGSLAVAVWSGEGFTAQLNRADTLPYRLSPGQVVIPGLSSLTSAADYAGRLDLYNGEFREQGGGLTAVAYVQTDTDMLVIDVSGAKPDEPQIAMLKLWPPREPHPLINCCFGVLSETWIDDKNPEPSGRTFESLSAITAEDRDVYGSQWQPTQNT